MSEAFVEATPAEMVEAIAAIQQEFSQNLLAQQESLAEIEVLNDQTAEKIQRARKEAMRHGRHFRALCLTLLILCVMLLVFLLLCPI